MILDFSPADLMFTEIDRRYNSEEQEGFFLGVCSWQRTQRATPYQWARLFAKQQVQDFWKKYNVDKTAKIGWNFILFLPNK